MILDAKRCLVGKNLFCCSFNGLTYVSLIVKEKESMKRNHELYVRKFCPWYARDGKNNGLQNKNREITSAMAKILLLIGERVRWIHWHTCISLLQWWKIELGLL